MKTKVSIDWWKRCHMKQVLELERLAHGKRAESEEYFLELLREDTVIGCVALKAGEVVGFMIYELFKNRIDIIHFEVHPEWRRCSIGTQMFRNLIIKCQAKGRTAITWKVSDRNLIVQLFLRQIGAKCTKLIRNFFENTGDDALLFEYKVEKAPKVMLELEEIEE